MKIECQACGHQEEVNKELIAAVIGGSVSTFGLWAWASFLFAGTGMAFVICSAIVAGGPALYIYSEEIIQWLVKQGYSCKKCNAKNWVVYQNVAINPPINSIDSNLNKKIKSLEAYLSKDITTDLFFLNSLRNKIAHPDGWGINLESEDVQNHILSDFKVAAEKINYICTKTSLV